MPIIYKCSKCNHTIYVFMRAGQDYYGVPSPSELMVRVGNVCPSCKKPIEPNIDISRVIIKVSR